MTIPRSKLVDTSLTRWYHCVSRCVRQAFLLSSGEGTGERADGNLLDRKAWLENRTRELDGIFAVSVAGFSVMHNHIHLLLRVDSEVSQAWTDAEVIDRWLRLYPPRGSGRQPLTEVLLKEIKAKILADPKRVAVLRERLGSLSWFMKCLKEPLARLANKSENRRGAFFEGRFKSIAVLDTEGLLAVCAYIDLNPVYAGLASTPEESEYTSCRARIEHVRQLGRVTDLKSAENGSVQSSQSNSGLEEGLWLIPIEDRRSLDSRREGIIPAFTLGNYLKLVDFTGRMVREGKCVIDREFDDILSRIQSTTGVWQQMIQRLRGGRLVGRFIAGSRERLRNHAHKLGLSRAMNLATVPL